MNWSSHRQNRTFFSYFTHFSTIVTHMKLNSTELTFYRINVIFTRKQRKNNKNIDLFHLFSLLIKFPILSLRLKSRGSSYLASDSPSKISYGAYFYKKELRDPFPNPINYISNGMLCSWNRIFATKIVTCFFLRNKLLVKFQVESVTMTKINSSK